MTQEEWNKEFEIASVSRADLQELGLSIQQVDSLTDADMQAIAQEMSNLYCDNGYWEDLQQAYEKVSAEKEHSYD